MKFALKFALLCISAIFGIITWVMISGGLWFAAFMMGIPTLVFFLLFCGSLNITKTEAEKGLRK